MNLDELQALVRDSNPGVVPILSWRILAMIEVIRAADAMRKRLRVADLKQEQWGFPEFDAARAKLEEL